MSVCEIDGKTIELQKGSAAIVTIVWSKNDKKCIAKQLTLVPQWLMSDKLESLDDCLKEVGYDGDGCVTVIIDEPLSGTIYQYGNYSNVGCVKHGETKGYA